MGFRHHGFGQEAQRTVGDHIMRKHARPIAVMYPLHRVCKNLISQRLANTQKQGFRMSYNGLKALKSSIKIQPFKSSEGPNWGINLLREIRPLDAGIRRKGFYLQMHFNRVFHVILFQLPVTFSYSLSVNFL